MCCNTTASHGNDIALILPAKLPIVKRHADLDQATFSAHITRTYMYGAVVWLDALDVACVRRVRRWTAPQIGPLP